MTGSWQTTLFGILAAAGLAMSQGANPGSWLHLIGQVLAVVGTGGIGVTARDNNKSSEDVGVKR